MVVPKSYADIGNDSVGYSLLDAWSIQVSTMLARNVGGHSLLEPLSTEPRSAVIVRGERTGGQVKASHM